MFGVLVESNPTRRRRRGAVVVSVAVHAAVILAGVWAAADGAPQPQAAPPEVMLPPQFHDPQRQPQASARVEPADGAVAAPVSPSRPQVPTLPPEFGIDVRLGLPPLDAPLGDPFAGAPSTVAEIGVRAHRNLRGLNSEGVLDGRHADKPALPLDDNVPPRYPDALRVAGIEGTVEVEFVIDASGRVQDGSIRSVQADHRIFLDAVRAALPTYRYLPAEYAGRPVPVLVRQRFAFALER